MKAIEFIHALITLAIIFFTVFAMGQLFIMQPLPHSSPITLPKLLPNALVYCLCAWILARVRNSL